MEINEFNQEKLRLLDTEQLLAFYGIFGTLSSPKAEAMVKGIARELKRRKYTLGEENLNEVDVKSLLKGLGKGTRVAGKALKTAIKVGYPIARDMVKATWMTAKKIGGAIGDLMDDPEFRKLFTKYVDNPEDPNRLKKVQAYADGMLSDAPVSGMESVQMKKLRIEKVCSIVLGEDFDTDFIYEDVDFTKPSAIKEAYKLFEATKWWTVTITKKAGKLFKGQTVDVKARNSAEAIKKGIKQMKGDPSLVPSGSVDAVLGEANDLEEAYDSKMYYAKFKGRIEGPYKSEKEAYYDTKGDAEWIKKGKDIKESTDLEEAKRMKYDKVIKKLKDGEWDTSMDVKQRMHLTYTDNNTGKKKVVFVEADDLDEVKNVTVRTLRQMLFKIDSSAADKFRRELFNIDKQDSPATNAQIKKAKKIIGNRFGKDAFLQIEAKGDKQQDIESLEKMIKNPDPRRFSQYGGKEGYLKMLNSKLAKLKA